MGTSLSCRPRFSCFQGDFSGAHTPTESDRHGSHRGGTARETECVSPHRRSPWARARLRWRPTSASALAGMVPSQVHRQVARRTWPGAGSRSSALSPKPRPVRHCHSSTTSISTSPLPAAPNLTRPSVMSASFFRNGFSKDRIEHSGCPQLPVALHSHCFSCCETGNAVSLQYLLAEHPGHTLNMTARFEVDIGTGSTNDAQATELTPLQVAAIFGHLQVAYLLLSRVSTDANAQDPVFRMTALHFALLMRNDAVSELLCRHPALQLGIMDHRGDTPLHAAVARGCDSVVSLVVAHRLVADVQLHLVNCDLNSVLHLAAAAAPTGKAVGVLLESLTRGWVAHKRFRRFQQLATPRVRSLARRLRSPPATGRKLRPQSFPLRAPPAPTTLKAISSILPASDQPQPQLQLLGAAVTPDSRRANGTRALPLPKHLRGGRFNLTYVKAVLQMNNADGLTVLDLLLRRLDEQRAETGPGTRTALHTTDDKERAIITCPDHFSPIYLDSLDHCLLCVCRTNEGSKDQVAALGVDNKVTLLQEQVELIKDIMEGSK